MICASCGEPISEGELYVEARRHTLAKYVTVSHLVSEPVHLICPDNLCSVP